MNIYSEYRGLKIHPYMNAMFWLDKRNQFWLDESGEFKQNFRNPELYKRFIERQRVQALKNGQLD